MFLIVLTRPSQKPGWPVFSWQGINLALFFPTQHPSRDWILRSLGVGGVRAPCRPRLKTDTRSTSLFYGAPITQELSRSLTQQTKKDRWPGIELIFFISWNAAAGCIILLKVDTVYTSGGGGGVRNRQNPLI